MACNDPRRIDRESETTFRLGVNGNTSFKNIESLPGHQGVYTRFGHGEIIFYNNGTRETFAIFSVPADTFAETYFLFEVEYKDESSPGFLLSFYAQNIERANFSIPYDTGYAELPQIVSGDAGRHIVRLSGDFSASEFRQKNFVAIGTNSLLATTNMNEAGGFITSMDNQTKNLVKKNTAYIIAYPWRTIRVAFFEEVYRRYAGAPSRIELQSINICTDYIGTIFAQAICRIETVKENYDAKIVFSNRVSGVVFYDERGNVFDPFKSERLTHAKIGRSYYDIFYKRICKRDMARAIAFQLGVSFFEDERESIKTIFQNLMNPDGAGTHLSFRQWNQLHIRTTR